MNRRKQLVKCRLVQPRVQNISNFDIFYEDLLKLQRRDAFISNIYDAIVFSDLNEEKMDTYSLDEVRKHNSEDDAWLVNKGRVFDVTEFISHHPGGRNVLLPKFGNDVTEIMLDPQIHKHTPFAFNMMSKYCIGKLASQV